MDSLGEIAVFAEVAHRGSFAEASRRYGLTASGVSRKIARLEQRLGVRLFNRTTRSLSLTEAGRILLERSGNILASVEDAENMVRNLSATPTGSLRIAASDAFSIQILIPFIQGFLSRYPKLSVTLLQGDGQIDLLDAGVDVAIQFDQPLQTSFISAKLIDDPWVICASPDYIKLNGRPDSPDALLKHKCLTIYARQKLTDHWTFTSGDTVQTLHVKGIFSGIGLSVREAAMRGLGIAQLAHFLVYQDIQAGRLIPLLENFTPQGNRAINIVYPNREHLPSKIRIFIDELRTYVNTALSTSGP